MKKRVFRFLYLIVKFTLQDVGHSISAILKGNFIAATEPHEVSTEFSKWVVLIARLVAPASCFILILLLSQETTLKGRVFGAAKPFFIGVMYALIECGFRVLSNKTSNYDFVPSWFIKNAPEKYRAHLVDQRDRLIEAGETKLVILQELSWFWFVAVVWTPIVSRLQRLVPPVRIFS